MMQDFRKWDQATFTAKYIVMYDNTPLYKLFFRCFRKPIKDIPKRIKHLRYGRLLKIFKAEDN